MSTPASASTTLPETKTKAETPNQTTTETINQTTVVIDPYALHVALDNKDMQRALNLIEQKADVNVYNRGNFTAQHRPLILCMMSFISASLSGTDYPGKPYFMPVLKSLLEASADPNAFGTTRDTTAHTALGFALRISNESERSAVIKLLVEHKADPILANSFFGFSTPIMDAISLGHNAIAEEWCDMHIGKANDKMSEEAQNIFGMFSAVGNTLALEKGFVNQKINHDWLHDSFKRLGHYFNAGVVLYCDKGNMRHASELNGMGRAYADNPNIEMILWDSLIALNKKIKMDSSNKDKDSSNNNLSDSDFSFIFIGKIMTVLKELTNTTKWYLKYIDCSDLYRYDKFVGNFHTLNSGIQTITKFIDSDIFSCDVDANLYKSASALVGYLLEEEFIRQRYFEILKQHIKLKEQGQENEVDTLIFLDKKEKIERFLELWKESKGLRYVDAGWMEYAKATIHKCLRPNSHVFVYRTMKFKTPANERFKFNQLSAPLQTHIMSYAEESPLKVEFQDPRMMTLFARHRLAWVKPKQVKQHEQAQQPQQNHEDNDNLPLSSSLT